MSEHSRCFLLSLGNRIFVSYMRIQTILLVCCCAWMSCEKDITVDLPQGEPQTVIEGTIVNDEYPEVILTRSFSYFSHISVDQLKDAFVHNAVITVSDGNSTMQLKEFSKDTTNRVKWYYYTADTTQPAAFKGKLNKSYTLRVAVDDQTFNAVTTIPGAGMVIDSTWSTIYSKDPTLARLWARITDPQERGNYVRYRTARNGGVYRPGINSTIDDQIVNGTSFNTQLDAGHDRTQEINFDTYGYFKRGDSVNVEFSNIDKATFDFWRSLDLAYASNGNVFASPIQVRGNISGALGYWGGYGARRLNVKIRK
ncbi:DUF4249 domain-containing protein [Chitinophaga agrisoli]|uniref:DUF4249 domain-containing protein n=2 Tax=Chitinophaga agrisoli TaxID=2607653 RepID=A0A5B2VML6_9BACT|nr:DUF4249 domain-containing protein [Chitinophaga agrisoli]